MRRTARRNWLGSLAETIETGNGMPKLNTRRVKSNATYSTQEVADLLEVHPRTVQGWYSEGLPRIDDRRPFLVLGANLIEFMRLRKSRNRKKCADNELYCCRCRVPRLSRNGFVTYQVLNSKTMIVRCLCSVCGSRMSQLRSIGSLDQLQRAFDGVERHQENLSVCGQPIVNTDKRQAEKA